MFGGACLLGAAALWLRRMTNPRVRAASRWMDINILGWLALTAAAGDADTMIRLADWVQSILYLHPDPNLLAGIAAPYKFHMVLGMSVFLFFPFTRLVHIWSAPFGYLGRAYQIVRARRVV